MGKFAWGVKAKHCWVMSPNFLFSKVCWQCPAMFCLYTSSKLSLSIIWIFTEDEGDGIKSRLPFKIFSTLLKIWSALALDYHFRFGFLDRFEIYVICILLKIKSPQPILPYCTNCSGREGARKKYVLVSAGFNIISYLHLIWLRWRPL